MTDKQIIIDGVDVSGCLFFTQYAFCTAQLEILGGSGKCSVNNQNCYYKQLKRKEQECERLKRDYFKQNEWLQEQKKELDQLKAENKKLKKRVNELEECEDIFFQENKDFRKIYSCLQGIKEIADYEFKELMNAEDYHNMTEILQQILQKISECEGNDE